MKLSKLYSNKPFQNITFITDKGGLNVIVGDAKGLQEGSNSHSLGKTKLAELLDFMLLKGVDKKYFFYRDSQKIKFAGYEFYLEILLNNGQFLTIKRSVDEATKISFKLKNKASEGYILDNEFDTKPSSFPKAESLNFDDEATKIAFRLKDKASEGYILEDEFDTKPSSFPKAKTYLNELLNFDFCKQTNEDYRRLVSYSLRSQGDYEPKMNTIFQLRKFAKNKDKDWKPLLFNLLGFDGNVLKQKFDLEEDIKDSTKTIKAQEKDFDIKHEDKDLLVGKIQAVESEKTKISSELENLNFYQQDKNIIQNLVGTIETEIAELNTIAYNLEFDIKKLEEAIRNEFSFDLNKTKSLFEEVGLYFPDQLSKSYEQLVDFNHKITQERNLQIRETLKEKKEEERKINTQLIALNKQKEQHRDLIQDTSLFKKYATYQKQLIEIERELSHFHNQLDAIEEIERKRERIEETLKDELNEIKGQLKTIVDTTATNDLYMNIRKTFSEIVRQVLHETAIITIKPNSTYNIDFKPEFPNSAKDEGNTYYKILCVAFDLAILINYRNQSHFRFVYHDDVIAGDDNGVKSRLIDTVREICLKYDIQYIFSVVKDNIPPSQDLSENTILELHDKSDDGKLFKMSF